MSDSRFLILGTGLGEIFIIIIIIIIIIGRDYRLLILGTGLAEIMDSSPPAETSSKAARGPTRPSSYNLTPFFLV